MRTFPPLPLTLIALLAVLPAVRVPAQQPAAPDPAATTPAALADKPAATEGVAKAAEEAKGAATKGKDAAGRDTLSVDFPDEDIRNILRNVADLFELNIIMPDTLQGKTTIKLRDVTWRQIFTNVLAPVNYTFTETDNIIKIVSNESLTQEPVATEVFLLNYARATDILPTISSLIDAAVGGKIVVDTRSNALVITERPTRMNRVRPIIESLDRATDQVMIESKFVEVTSSDVKNIGVNWSSLQNFNIGAGPFSGAADRTRGQTSSDGVDGSNNTTRANQAITSTGTTTTIANTQGTGSTTAGTVTSTNGTPTSTSSVGTTGTLTNTTTIGGTNGITGNITDTGTSALNLLNSIVNTGATNRTLSAVFSADQFKLVLSALQSQNDVKIVSNPTIVTLNNTEASINVGESRPIPKYQYNQQTGGFEVSGFDYKDIGINLKVTPQVNARGFIKLTLTPEVSQTNGSETFGVAHIPVIGVRKATTNVSLKDGFTMGIGGMLTTQSTKTENKVPVLGSIPVLGRLFRSNSKDEQVRNLIIFVTAKTISAEGASVEQVFDSERVRQLELRREDLPGYRDGSSPYLPSAPAPGPSNTSEKTSAGRSSSR